MAFYHLDLFASHKLLETTERLTLQKLSAAIGFNILPPGFKDSECLLSGKAHSCGCACRIRDTAELEGWRDLDPTAVEMSPVLPLFLIRTPSYFIKIKDVI